MEKKTLIHNIQVFDGYGFTSPTTVVIKGGFISNDSSNPDKVIDGTGRFLLPGFIDAHVHVGDKTHLNRLLNSGVTTALDMAMYPAERIDKIRGFRDTPEIKTAGVPLSKAGSVHSCVLPLPPESLAVKPTDASSWVQKRVKEGSDYIKIIADVPGPDQETMNAVVVEAHKRGKKVVAHAATYTPWQMALDANVDIVTHLAVNKPVDEEMAERMLAAGTIAIPTLCMAYETTTKKPSIGTLVSMLAKPKTLHAIIKNQNGAGQKQTYANAVASISNLHRAGVPILAGTDCHEEPNSVFDVPHGESLHRELQRLVEAGLSNVEALRAATVLPAHHFGLQDRGEIADGKQADLVLLREDPTLDIRATSKIDMVWLRGKEAVNYCSTI